MIGGIIDAVVGAATNVRDYNRSVNQYDQQYGLQKDQLYRGKQILVNDLKKAGLHPTLAAGMPSNQTSTISTGLPGQVQTDFAGVERSIKNSQLERELIKAQIENVQAQTKDILTNTSIKGQSTTINNAQSPSVKAKTFPVERQEIMQWEDIGSPVKKNRKHATKIASQLKHLPVGQQEKELLEYALGDEPSEVVVAAINGSYMAKKSIWNKIESYLKKVGPHRRGAMRQIKKWWWNLDVRNQKDSIYYKGER